MILDVEDIKKICEIKEAIREKRDDEEFGYLSILSVDPTDEEALLGLLKLYEEEDVEVVNALYEQLMNFYPQKWEYFQKFATILKKKKLYHEALQYYELAFKKLVLFWRNLPIEVEIDKMIRKIKEDIQAINRDLPPTNRPFSLHLKTHILVQKLMESKTAISINLLEKLLKTPELTVYILTGIIKNYKATIYLRDNYFVPLNAIRILGELRSSFPIYYLSIFLGEQNIALKREAMAALAKISQRYPEEVSNILRNKILKTTDGNAILAAIETLGWLGDYKDNFSFLLDRLDEIEKIPEELRSDYIEFICAAIANIKKEKSEKIIENICERYKKYIKHEDIKFLPKLKKGKNFSTINIISESIYEKCCKTPSKWDELKYLTATTARDIIKSKGIKISHSYPMLALMFGEKI